MLLLAREVNEKIIIRCGEKVIELLVTEISRGKVRLGFTAPKEVKINREEVDEAIHGKLTSAEPIRRKNGRSPN